MLKRIIVIVCFIALSVMFFSCQDVNSSDSAYLQNGSGTTQEAATRDYEDWDLKW